MSDQITIGVDIGGSHIISAAVNLKTLEIVPETTFAVKVDNKAKKETVLKRWSEAINKTISSASLKQHCSIGFAIPGPFNYKEGIALFEGGNDKYENLYGVSITEELPKYLISDNIQFRFLNDATSFAVGVSAQGKAKNCEKILAVTLGTGFGSAFIKNGMPLISHSEVPKNGCLWDKTFKDGIGDDYFSTRWFIKRYAEVSSKKVAGVKEIAQADTSDSKHVFKEFGSNMGQFMIPFLQKFNPDLIIMGGNIAHAGSLFIPSLQNVLVQAGLKIEVETSFLMEDAAIIGSAQLFNSEFWNQVQKDLPIR